MRLVALDEEGHELDTDDEFQDPTDDDGVHQLTADNEDNNLDLVFASSEEQQQDSQETTDGAAIAELLPVDMIGKCCCGCGANASRSNHYCKNIGNRVMAWFYQPSQNVEEVHGSIACCTTCYIQLHEQLCTLHIGTTLACIRRERLMPCCRQMYRVGFHYLSSAEDATQQLLPRMGHQEEVCYINNQRKPWNNKGIEWGNIHRKDQKEIKLVCWTLVQLLGWTLSGSRETGPQVCPWNNCGSKSVGQLQDCVCKGGVLKDCLRTQRFKVKPIKTVEHYKLEEAYVNWKHMRQISIW